MRTAGQVERSCLHVGGDPCQVLQLAGGRMRVLITQGGISNVLRVVSKLLDLLDILTSWLRKLILKFVIVIFFVCLFVFC